VLTNNVGSKHLLNASLYEGLKIQVRVCPPTRAYENETSARGRPSAIERSHVTQQHFH
jgi:hypothetical protein